MVEAAARVFARAGHGGATMAAIAREAGVSTGNLYRYFESKDALLETVVTDAIADEHLRILRKRVASLVRADDLLGLDPEAKRDGEALLSFWLEHREAIIVLLRWSEGTRWEGYRARFVDELLQPTAAALRARAGTSELRPVIRRTLERIFENTARTIVAILEESDDEAAARQSFAAFWSYQLGGLRGLQEWVET